MMNKYVNYLPNCLSVNRDFNIADIIEIWENDEKLKKYAKAYKYWREQSNKFSNPLYSRYALYNFFIECYQSARKGKNGFFIERVCYSTNIILINEFKFKRIIMSWYYVDEDNINRLLKEFENNNKIK